MKTTIRKSLSYKDAGILVVGSFIYVCPVLYLLLGMVQDRLLSYARAKVCPKCQFFAILQTVTFL